MKYGSFLVVFATLIFMEPAQGVIVTNGSFSSNSGSFTGWGCNLGTASSGDCTNTLLDVNPYWSHVDTAPAGAGKTDWAHLGDWNSSSPAFIDQDVTLSKGTGYTLTFIYGQYFDWTAYTSPDFSELNGITATLGGTSEYSATNFFVSSYLTAGQGIYVLEKKVTVGYTSPGSGSGTETENLNFSAYDTLQDVILSGISIVKGLPPVGAQVAVTSLYFDGAQIDSTPEPATFGFMAASCAILFFFLKKRARTAALTT